MAGNPRGNVAVTLKTKLIHLPGILVLFSNLVHAFALWLSSIAHCLYFLRCSKAVKRTFSWSVVCRESVGESKAAKILSKTVELLECFLIMFMFAIILVCCPQLAAVQETQDPRWLYSNRSSKYTFFFFSIVDAKEERKGSTIDCVSSWTL